MKIFYGICKAIVYLPFKIIFPCKVLCRANLMDKKYISVSNHLSAMDVVTVSANVSGFRRFMAKKELAEKAFTRNLLKWLGAIYIDREGTDMRAMKEALNTLRGDGAIAIFPEGTRNKENETLQQIKGGAAFLAVKGNATLQPIMIYTRTKAFRKNYIYIAEPFTLPYTSKDRYNTAAMEECVAIIAEKMKQAQDELNDCVKNKRFKEFARRNKEIKKLKKAKVKADGETE